MGVDLSVILSQVTWQGLVNYIINLGISGLIIWKFVEWMLKTKIKFEIDRSIKEYDHKLLVITEQTKSHLARQQQDFSLYNTKRHEVYLKFHQLLLEANGKLMGLRGVCKIPDYKQFSKDEIKEWLNQNQFIEEDKQNIINLWDSDRDEAENLLYKVLTLINGVKANNAIIEAHNMLINYQLYISDKICDISLKIINDMICLLDHYRSVALPDVILLDKQQILRGSINDQIKQLTQQMKTELRRGDYPGIDH